jgi:WhiB family redox-sensing transcriptional regulator
MTIKVHHGSRHHMAESPGAAGPVLGQVPEETGVIPRGGTAASDAAAAYLLGQPEPEHHAETAADDELGWQDRALCSQTDPEAFFPEKGGSTREARRVCRSCEVRAECLEYALGHDERFGIWGGFSERERRRLKHEDAPV